jgi:hypothetical protein
VIGSSMLWLSLHCTNTLFKLEDCLTLPLFMPAIRYNCIAVLLWVLIVTNFCVVTYPFLSVSLPKLYTYSTFSNP